MGKPETALNNALKRIETLSEAGPFPCRGEFVLPTALDDAISAYMTASGITVRSQAMRRIVRAGVIAEGKKLLGAA